MDMASVRTAISGSLCSVNINASRSLGSRISLVSSIISRLHLSHTVVLSNDSTRLFSLDLSNFNLALPVLVLALFFGAVVALLDEVERLGHVLFGTDLCIELSFLVLENRYLLLGLLDVCKLLEETSLFELFVFHVLGGFALSLCKVLLQLSKLLGR